MLFSRSYQGNGWWIGFGLLSLFLLSQFLLEVRRRRGVGMPVDVNDVITMCVFCLGFLAVAVWQVLTHR
jgi:hypothetical protein